MQIALHIGYHKTATTWLQQKVFPNIENPEFHYSGRYYFNKRFTDKIPFVKKHISSPVQRQIKINEFLNALSFEGLFNIPIRKHILFQLFHDEKINLFSHENLLRPYETERTAERLRLLTDGASVKIILAIREQRDLIKSRYFHDLNLGLFKEYKLSEALETDEEFLCAWPFCNFKKRKCICRKEGKKFIHLNFYNFLNMYQLWADKFGKKNIHVMLYENLRDDPLNELENFFEFLNADIDHKQMAVLSKKEPVLKTPGKKDEPEKKYKDDFERCDQLIFDTFRESNKALSRIINLPLKQYNYF